MGTTSAENKVSGENNSTFQMDDHGIEEGVPLTPRNTLVLNMSQQHLGVSGVSSASSSRRSSTRSRTSKLQPERIHNIPQPSMPEDAISVISTMSADISYTEQARKKWTVVSLLCVTYALMLIVISIGLEISYIFAEEVTERSIAEYQLVLYSVSGLSLAILLVLGATGSLSKHDHYKDRQKTTFIRTGMLVLGSGSLLFRLLYLFEMTVMPVDCDPSVEIAVVAIALLAVSEEIEFLFTRTKVRINSSFLIACIARLIVAHNIATNAILWLRLVVDESLHEIQHAANIDDATNATAHTISGPHDPNDGHDNDTNNNRICVPQYMDMTKRFSPYIFPITIEFYALVCTMWVSVWENCGVSGVHAKLQPDTCNNTVDKRHSNFVKANEGIIVDIGCKLQMRSGYKNTAAGFLLGWVVLMLTIATTIIVIQLPITTDPLLSIQTVEYASYGPNCVLSLLLVVTILLAIFRMRNLPFHKDEKPTHGHTSTELRNHLGHKVDRRLLSITVMSLVIFKLLSTIAAWTEGNVLVAIDGVLSIIVCMMQTLFINAYTFEKMCVTTYQRRVKPGRQCLEFIRLTNLSLWIINTFLLKDMATKTVQYTVFSTTAFAIIDNVFQPLTILHYFHAMICIAEAISEVYSEKHIYTTEEIGYADDPSKPTDIASNAQSSCDRRCLTVEKLHHNTEVPSFGRVEDSAMV